MAIEALCRNQKPETSYIVATAAPGHADRGVAFIHSHSYPFERATVGKVSTTTTGLEGDSIRQTFGYWTSRSIAEI